MSKQADVIQQLGNVIEASQQEWTADRRPGVIAREAASV